MALPVDTSCEAEYEDGFVLNETEQNDVSLFGESGNTFYDVLNRLPEAKHGGLVRFSVFWKNERHDVDWRGLPDNARPIRFRHGYNTFHVDGTVESGWSGVDFGYQYTDEVGSNQQEVTELR